MWLIYTTAYFNKLVGCSRHLPDLAFQQIHHGSKLNWHFLHLAYHFLHSFIFLPWGATRLQLGLKDPAQNQGYAFIAHPAAQHEMACSGHTLFHVNQVSGCFLINLAFPKQPTIFLPNTCGLTYYNHTYLRGGDNPQKQQVKKGLPV